MQPSNESSKPAEVSPAPPHKRRWLRYSLRTLLAFVTLCALVAFLVGLCMRWRNQMQAEETAVAALKGMPVSWVTVRVALPTDDEHNLERPPSWFCNWAGKQEFSNAYGVTIIPGLTWVDDPGPPLKAIRKAAPTGLLLTGTAPAAGTARGPTSIDLAWLKDLRGLQSLAIHSIEVDRNGLEFHAAPDADAMKKFDLELGLSYLKGLRHLSSVSLDLLTLSDDGISALASLPLKDLSLRAETCNVRNWPAFSSPAAMHSLHLEFKSGVRESELAWIVTLPNLSDLELMFPLDGHVLGVLQDHATLTRLKLSCGGLDVANLRYLCRLPALRELTLDQPQLTEDFVAALADLDQLEAITISVTTPEQDRQLSDARIIALAKGLPSLKRLELRSHGVTSLDAARLKAYRRASAGTTAPPRSDAANTPAPFSSSPRRDEPNAVGK